MIAARQRLQRRVSITVALCVALVGLVFGTLTIGAAYTIEDRFFERMLIEESARLEQGFAATGQWGVPQRAFMQVAPTLAQLPAEVQPVLREEPERREVFGQDGRHYHVRRLAGAPAAWLVAEVSRDLVVRPIRANLVRVLVITLLLLTAVSVWLAIRAARRTTAPLSRLATIVESITPTAMPSAIAADFGDDEVGILARGLDGLTERLREFVAREQAFTRDASHELRTPLAVLRGTTERLLASPSLDATQRALVRQAAQSIGHLEQTVHTLLTLAREDVSPAVTTPTRIRPLVEEVVVEQAALLDGKAVTLETTLADDTTLPAPAPVLRILLANLIGNAFAHSAEGTITIAGAGQELCIMNDRADAAPLPDALGTPFAKGSQSSGWGLGLSIVQRLCDRYALVVQIEPRASQVAVRVTPRGVGQQYTAERDPASPGAVDGTASGAR